MSTPEQPSSSTAPSIGSTKQEVATAVSLTAAILLALVAGFQVLQGLAAVTDEELFVTKTGYSHDLDVSVWGWIHVVLGAIGLAVAVAIVKRQVLGYLGGIVLAYLVAFANFAFLPHSPVGSALVIAGSVLLIWALCVCLVMDRDDSVGADRRV